MIQAKDYHNDTTLGITKMNKHAVVCGDVSLDGIFGKSRLLCVTGSKAVVLATRQCLNHRDFMPYVSDEGGILDDLLSTLALERAVRFRKALKFAVLCDSEKHLYCVDGSVKGSHRD
jgi:hypothetical protein